MHFEKIVELSGCGVSSWNLILCGTSYSEPVIWKVIALGFPCFSSFVGCAIGEGSIVYFLEDCWVLCELFSHLYLYELFLLSSSHLPHCLVIFLAIFRLQAPFVR